MCPVQSPAFNAPTSFALSTVSLDRRSVWLRAAGELDLAAAGDLALLFQRQADAGRCFVWLDLSQVTFLDCSCLGVLVSARHRFLAAGGTFTLCGVSARVEWLLTLTGLHATLFTDTAVSDPHHPVRAASPASGGSTAVGLSSTPTGPVTPSATLATQFSPASTPSPSWVHRRDGTGQLVMAVTDRTKAHLQDAADRVLPRWARAVPQP
jgi:anti-sigma B factor antagonist